MIEKRTGDVSGLAGYALIVTLVLPILEIPIRPFCDDASFNDVLDSVLYEPHRNTVLALPKRPNICQFLQIGMQDQWGP
ncbi:MAG: hypothetical protein IIA72_12980 [Proteobacteria bacterium]|nr:hypothetical protein [Pseudomonadota bacterium]